MPFTIRMQKQLLSQIRKTNSTRVLEKIDSSRAGVGGRDMGRMIDSCESHQSTEARKGKL